MSESLSVVRSILLGGEVFSIPSLSWEGHGGVGTVGVDVVVAVGGGVGGRAG
jgi:hypothetical protein